MVKIFQNISVLFAVIIALLLQQKNCNATFGLTFQHVQMDFNLDKVDKCGDNISVTTEEPWSDIQLPKYVFPIDYKLLLAVDHQSDTFESFVNITIQVRRDTRYIILHAKDLYVHKSDFLVRHQNGTFINLESVCIYSKYDYLVVKTRTILEPGKYFLPFLSAGKFTEHNGLYKNNYTVKQDEKRPYVSTFFAPNYARRVFPCFDEPSFKATFTVSVIHNSSYFALSNSMVENLVDLPNGLKRTSFETTLPMSSYLLCVTVCDFSFREITSNNGILIRGYAIPQNIEKIASALTWTNNILSYFENLLNIPFPKKKLDFVTFPGFDTVPMENWGLIAYDDSTLLIDNSSSMVEKLKAAVLIGHELSHMWFGNLVTMEWWNETWLNEGFATHFQWKGAKHVLPECFEAGDSGLQVLYQIMLLDRYKNAIPVIHPVTESVMFDDVYNTFIYKKGGSLLRMLGNMMGEDDFIHGISNYLKKNAFGIGTTEQLWEELTAASRKKLNITSAMNSWMFQKNFPYLTQEYSTEGNEFCTFQQRRFLTSENTSGVTEYDINFLWNISVRYMNSNITYHTVLDSANKIDIFCPRNKWLKLNVDFTGYYIVNYEENNWKKLIQELEGNDTVLSAADRLNLLFDAYTLASAGILPYDIPLRMTNYLRKEEYHEAWSFALQQLRKMKSYNFENTDTVFRIKKYIRDLSKPLYDIYKWTDEGSYLQKRLRKELIDAACGNDNVECQHTAVDMFQSWIEDDRVDAEVAEQVFEYGMEQLNRERTFDFMWNRYVNESNILMKNKYRRALPKIKSRQLLKRLLDYAMHEEYFTRSTRDSLLIDMSNNDRGLAVASEFLFSQWNAIGKYFNNLESVAEKVFSHFNTVSDLQKVEEFYSSHTTATENSQHRARALRNIRLNIEWFQKFETTITNWFENNVVY